MILLQLNTLSLLVPLQIVQSGHVSSDHVQEIERATKNGTIPPSCPIES